MKHLIILCDGMSDNPAPQLGGKTSLDEKKRFPHDFSMQLAPLGELFLFIFFAIRKFPSNFAHRIYRHKVNL